MPSACAQCSWGLGGGDRGAQATHKTSARGGGGGGQKTCRALCTRNGTVWALLPNGERLASKRLPLTRRALVRSSASQRLA